MSNVGINLFLGHLVSKCWSPDSNFRARVPNLGASAISLTYIHG